MEQSTQTQARELLLGLSGLTAFRQLLSLPPVQQLQVALQAALNREPAVALQARCQLAYELYAAGHECLTDYLYDQLRYVSSPFGEAVAADRLGPGLRAAGERDLALLSTVASRGPALLDALLQGAEGADSLPPLSVPEQGFSPQTLVDFYRSHGTGLFSKYRAFLWRRGQLIPVEQPDFIPPEQLVGYRLQRDQVQANTAALVAGKRVNNVLLYGESGTGKSATVKSMLGVPEFRSLRLIELDKGELEGIPELVRLLAQRPQKFILYLDDLAFDRDDHTYSMLKTILEGGLEQKPANVAVYATSNRRHLVRETFSDRMGDEVDKSETIEEKTSLSERFGLRIPFNSLNQEQYVALCHQLAQQAGLSLSREELRPLAIRFNLRHPGRTPRVARQFIQSLQV